MAGLRAVVCHEVHLLPVDVGYSSVLSKLLVPRGSGRPSSRPLELVLD